MRTLDWLDDLRELDSGPDPLGDYVTVLTYLMTVGETTENELAAAFEQLGPRAKEAIVTTAETIEERGRKLGEASGRKLGEADGRTAALIELLTAKFGPLSATTLHRVRSADPAQGRTWTTRILTANTLDELFD